VAGLPVAVHDDVAEARSFAARLYQAYGELPNYQRILAHGGIAAPAEAVIVGDEDSVAAQVRALFEAGATDFWAAPFPVGGDPAASRPAPGPCWPTWRGTKASWSSGCRRRKSNAGWEKAGTDG